MIKYICAGVLCFFAFNILSMAVPNQQELLDSCSVSKLCQQRKQDAIQAVLKSLSSLEVDELEEIDGYIDNQISLVEGRIAFIDSCMYFVDCNKIDEARFLVYSFLTKKDYAALDQIIYHALERKNYSALVHIMMTLLTQSDQKTDEFTLEVVKKVLEQDPLSIIQYDYVRFAKLFSKVEKVGNVPLVQSVQQLLEKSKELSGQLFDQKMGEYVAGHTHAKIFLVNYMQLAGVSQRIGCLIKQALHENKEQEASLLMNLLLYIDIFCMDGVQNLIDEICQYAFDHKLYNFIYQSALDSFVDLVADTTLGVRWLNKLLLAKVLDQINNLQTLKKIEVAIKRGNLQEKVKALNLKVTELLQAHSREMQKKSLIILLDRGGGIELAKAQKGELGAITANVVDAIENDIPCIASTWLLYDLNVLSLTGKKIQANQALEKLKQQWTVFCNKFNDLVVLLPGKSVDPLEFGFKTQVLKQCSPIIAVEPVFMDYVYVEHLTELFSLLVYLARLIVVGGHGKPGIIAALDNPDFIVLVFFLNKKELGTKLLIISSCYASTNMLAVQNQLLHEKDQFLQGAGMTDFEQQHLVLAIALGALKMKLVAALANETAPIGVAISSVEKTLKQLQDEYKAQRREYEALRGKVHDRRKILWHLNLTKKMNGRDGQAKIVRLQDEIVRLEHQVQEREKQFLCRQQISQEEKIIKFPIVVQGYTNNITISNSFSECLRRFNELFLSLPVGLSRFYAKNPLMTGEHGMKLTDALAPLGRHMTNLPMVRVPGACSHFRPFIGFDKNICPLTSTSIRALHLEAASNSCVKGPKKAVDHPVISVKDSTSAFLVYPTNLSDTSFEFGASKLPQFFSALNGPAQHYMEQLIVSDEKPLLEVVSDLFLQPAEGDGEKFYDVSPKLWNIASIVTTP